MPFLTSENVFWVHALTLVNNSFKSPTFERIVRDCVHCSYAVLKIYTIQGVRLAGWSSVRSGMVGSIGKLTGAKPGWFVMRVFLHPIRLL